MMRKKKRPIISFNLDLRSFVEGLGITDVLNRIVDLTGKMSIDITIKITTHRGKPAGEVVVQIKRAEK